MIKLKRIYLDHGASKPIDSRVLEALKGYMTEDFGNSSSLHSEGRTAKKLVEEAREEVANLIGAEDKSTIIFTSGGTESNNLALIGIAHRNKKKGNHIITSAIEHMSVINPCKDMQKEGFEITFVPVDNDGLLNPGKIREIGEIAKDKDIYFHTDCVAAAGNVLLDVEKENLDLVSLSSNDLYGPRGAGALYVRKGTKIQSIMYGGGQERGLRSGTENMYAIAGMGKAAEITKKEIKSDADRLTGLRDKLIDGILKNVDESYLTGHRTKRLPHHASFRFNFIEGESIILNLDMEGISASTGSACTSKTLEPSHVLLALGLKHEEAHGSLMLTLGRGNTQDDIDSVIDIVPNVVLRLREMSPLYKTE